MKTYLVEARLTYEVRANTADEALRLVSPFTQDARALGVYYSVGEKQETEPPKESNALDFHGLTKPVYAVPEVASLLGTSRGSIYELARRAGIRLGRRVLIPRRAIAAFLNGDFPLPERAIEASVPTKRPLRHSNPTKRSTSPEVVTVRQQRRQKEVKDKVSVSITEAARILHISTSQLRELLDQRKIYYTEYYGKREIPRKAIENFVNGLSAITVLEDNIAHYRANNQMDDEMEKIAAKLLAEWKIDSPEGPA